MMNIFMSLETVLPGREFNEWHTIASATREIDDDRSVDALCGAFGESITEIFGAAALIDSVESKFTRIVAAIYLSK